MEILPLIFDIFIWVLDLNIDIDFYNWFVKNYINLVWKDQSGEKNKWSKTHFKI